LKAQFFDLGCDAVTFVFICGEYIFFFSFLLTYLTYFHDFWSEFTSKHWSITHFRSVDEEILHESIELWSIGARHGWRKL